VAAKFERPVVLVSDADKRLPVKFDPRGGVVLAIGELEAVSSWKVRVPAVA
jgi:hypothetical protein